MNRAPLIMAAVAATAGVGGLIVFARPARSEGAIYGRRIAGTMLIALALLLGRFAWALSSWGGAT
ncbi:MAG: hypothetical protein JWN66_1293 [Sphingomonas bacterium]|uniref:hypothetical protein n=1 Tax=Sphingomonas bacterium TaxID=1895847 RepID=UPI00262139CA|nr:hypothetical protein [Sphingomonas bacterium]MDB5704177.1 hypothetical protein [Sphingomonas bacterium]